MIRQVLNILERMLKIIVCLNLSIIVVVLFYAVFMRFVLHNPPSWSMELSRFLFIWMVMIGAALVTREQSHIQITFIAERLPDKFRLLWFIILRVIMLVFCLILIHQGSSILVFFMEEQSPALDIAMGWIYLSIPLGGSLMFIYLFENTFDMLFKRFKSGFSKEN